MEVCKSFSDVGITDRSMVWNTDLIETLELQNLLVQVHGTTRDQRSLLL